MPFYDIFLLLFIFFFCSVGLLIYPVFFFPLFFFIYTLTHLFYTHSIFSTLFFFFFIALSFLSFSFHHFLYSLLPLFAIFFLFFPFISFNHIFSLFYSAFFLVSIPVTFSFCYIVALSLSFSPTGCGSKIWYKFSNIFFSLISQFFEKKQFQLVALREYQGISAIPASSIQRVSRDFSNSSK